uniref:Elongation of very long chain fatty acids protein n=1 Tax=Strigamia maritima TaxID=126957 RepID=T1IMP8_STRMM
MAQITASVAQFYNRTMELRDKRVDGWILMDSPLPTLLLCLSYVYGVTSLGPWIMKNKESLNLRKALVAYNFFMVLFSVYLFMELWLSGWGTGYSYRCQPVDFSHSPKAMRMANACWWYYFSKFIEFADTIFFVLRKKFNQVTLLHVIHHGCMPMSVWFGVRFTPGGHSTFFGLLNSLVHIFMYTYYGIAAMGPKYTKFLWWKKYMTTFQLMQFIGIIVHAFQLLFIDCNYPKAFVWWIGGHAVMFFFLFMDFYKQAYLRRRTTPKSNKITNGHLATLNGHTNKQSNGLHNGLHNAPQHVHENGHSKSKTH